MYNGTISGICWKNTANASEVNLYRNYAFKYDGTGRLLNADYGEGQTAVDKSDFGVS